MSETLRPQGRSEEIALFRAEIIGNLARRALKRRELASELRRLAAERYRPPGGESTRRFGVSTLERWLYAYRAGGLDALRPESRSKGFALALEPSQRELLIDIRRENPGASSRLILETLIHDGRLPGGLISAPTLSRLYQAQGLDRATLRQTPSGRGRMRWQADRPGDLWQGDVCHAHLLLESGKRHPVRIHALIDDCSRYGVALEAREHERERDMIEILIAAFRRHGPPGALYLDNGATYRGDTLRIACERLGIRLIHPKAGDAPARGKIERFWRTLREGCLDFCGSLSSLHDLNVRLGAFLDQHYHRAPHGGLFGKTPAEVWLAAEREREPIDEDRLRQALTVASRRRIRKDGTFSVDGRLYQLDQGFLAGRLVTIEYSLLDPETPPSVLHDAHRYAAHPTDPVANGRTKRPRPETPKARQVPFDPPGALLDRAAGRSPRPSEEKQP